MAVTDFVNTSVYQLILFLVLIHETVSYKTILLEESKLCKLKPDDPQATIQLEKEDKSSAIVTQKIYFAKWTGRYDFKCSFSVRAPDYYGIYAVIQVLNFRKNETTGVCKDYVSFHIPQYLLETFFFKYKEHKYFCGKMYAAQTYLAHSNGSNRRYSVNPVAKNAFVAPDGHMHVTIYVAQERLLKDEKLEVKIAFTSYKEGCVSKRKRHILCKECEWIWDGLAGDNVQNCPYTSCLDENHCQNLESPFEIYHVVSKESSTKVTVVAISSIIISFFVFTICLCACRRSQKCCWQLPPSNGVRVEMNRTRPNAEEEFVTTFHELPSDNVSPSAPPLNDVKDVPPSYESLFPSK